MNVKMQFPVQFLAGVHYHGKLIMNTYTIRLWMVTNTYNEKCHNVSLDRIKYFLGQELDSTVFINSEDTEAAELYVKAGMNITTLPGEPVDQIVGIMLFNKLSAICEGRMILGEVEISSTLGDNIVYMHNEGENIEGVEFPAWFDEPDLVHCDSVYLEDENVVSIHKASVWRELELGWPDDEPETANVSTEDNTVIFTDFGKDETK